MKENKDELIEELVHSFRDFKRIKLQNCFKSEDITHNERIVLFVLNDISNDNKVSLSVLRERIKLAPSTITPIITLLEEKGLIERNIDKTDRRNIFLSISPKGQEYTKKVQEDINGEMSKYIDFIGEEDTKQLIRLIKKTTEFFSGKEDI